MNPSILAHCENILVHCENILAHCEKGSVCEPSSGFLLEGCEAVDEPGCRQVVWTNPNSMSMFNHLFLAKKTARCNQQ